MIEKRQTTYKGAAIKLIVNFLFSKTGGQKTRKYNCKMSTKKNN